MNALREFSAAADRHTCSSVAHPAFGEPPTKPVDPAPADIVWRTVDISYQPDRDWTHAEYLEVLILRRSCAVGLDEYERIRAEIVVVERMRPDSASWLDYKEMSAC